MDIQTFDESEDSPEGTCNLLRQISNRITEDFVLVPCDFVPPPSLPLSTLLNKFRVDAMAEGSLATTCWFAPKKQEKGTVVEEWGPTSGTTSIIWDPTAGTLLHIDSPDDVDRDSEDISLKMSLLNKYVCHCCISCCGNLYFAGTPTPNCRPTLKTLMSTYAGDLCSISFEKSTTWIH